MALQCAKDGVPVDAKARKAALVGGGQTPTNVQYAKIDSDFPQPPKAQEADAMGVCQRLGSVAEIRRGRRCP